MLRGGPLDGFRSLMVGTRKRRFLDRLLLTQNTTEHWGMHHLQSFVYELEVAESGSWAEIVVSCYGVYFLSFELLVLVCRQTSVYQSLITHFVTAKMKVKWDLIWFLFYLKWSYHWLINELPSSSSSILTCSLFLFHLPSTIKARLAMAIHHTTVVETKNQDLLAWFGRFLSRRCIDSCQNKAAVSFSRCCWIFPIQPDIQRRQIRMVRGCEKFLPAVA